MLINIIQFALLGVGAGVAYVLLGQGLIVIYRGSGVLNFAQGAYAMAGAYTYYELHDVRDWPFAAAFVIAIVFLALIGAATHLIVMKHLRNASALARLIATLGILTLIQGIATLRYGSRVTAVAPFLPTRPITFGRLSISEGELWLLGIAVALTVVLYLVSRRTLLGLATSAVAENQQVASGLGWSPDLLATLTWALGAALAAVGGICIAPISGLTVTNLTLIVVAAMAAALIGTFSSFIITLIAGIGIGILQSELAGYVNVPGLIDAAPFFVIIVVMAIRGRVLPVRGYVIERLPMIGAKVIRLQVILPLALVLAVGLFVFPQGLTIAVTVQLVTAVILLSVVVVTGFAGQVSLAPFALAGIGAYCTGRLVSAEHWPFLAALPVGIIGAALVGVVLGLSALRTRGLNLAVVTLGLGLALQAMLFDNPNYTGGQAGTPVGGASLLHLDIDPIAYPARYGLFCLVLFVIVAMGVVNLRRGRAGRRFIAVRANERAAASLGINVAGAKLAAFGIASGIAGLGGILLGFESHSIVFEQFDVITSINSITWATIGGIGYVSGALAGSGFAVGGISTYLLHTFGSLAEWLPIIGGISLLIIVIASPDGIVGAIVQEKADPLLRFIMRKVRSLTAAWEARHHALWLQKVGLTDDIGEPHRVRPAALSVQGLRVTFGGVVAVDELDLTVNPGEIVGLVGPNGAGKTTFIDAVSGFVSLAEGDIRLDGLRLNGMSPSRRAQAGLVRSFQSVELFDDLTVLENLQAASDTRDRLAYISNLVRAGNLKLSPSAINAVRTFAIEDVLDQKPETLPFARRRLVAIARAVAAEPSILLLDEPAAGLDEHETEELGQFVRDLAATRGIGVLLIEHDMGLVMNLCDRVVVLEFGRKIADGPPEQVRRDPKVLAAYLGHTEMDEEMSELLKGAGQ